jgi:hypothetical protein
MFEESRLCPSTGSQQQGEPPALEGCCAIGGEVSRVFLIPAILQRRTDAKPNCKYVESDAIWKGTQIFGYTS